MTINYYIMLQYYTSVWSLECPECLKSEFEIFLIKWFETFAITHIITRVKIIVAPTGIPAKYEITYPVAVPTNPARIDQITILK